MNCEVDLHLLPYDAAEKGSILDRIVAELESGEWEHMRGAVAFLRSSGLYKKLVEALKDFGTSGGTVELTVGADDFGDQRGSDYAAVEALLRELEPDGNFRLYLYRETQRTFHPKMLLFSNEAEALLVLGSSNWSDGGLINNVEANVFVRLDLSQPEHSEVHDRLVSHFTTYWQGPGVGE